MLYDLKVNSMHSPLGIDTVHPTFSWKMHSNIKNTIQASYRIMVSENASFSDCVWDSTTVLSRSSHDIEYMGDELIPQTKYFVQVTVCDNFGNSDTQQTCFETGLMCEDYSNWTDGKNTAQWIGSPYDTVNTGAVSSYRFSVNFKALDGTCSIVVNARNRDKYVLFGVDTISRELFTYEKSSNSWSGSRAEGVKPYFNTLGKGGYKIPQQAIPEGTEFDEHSFLLLANDGVVTVKIDGISVIDNEEIFVTEKPFHPYKKRLFMFGFEQAASRAEYDNLKIEALSPYNKVLVDDGFDNPYSHLASLGKIEDGVLKVYNEFNLTVPDPAVAVRKQVNIDKDIESVRLYATARGVYDIYINGKKVNNDYFNPGFTDYRLRIMYQTYDVTDCFKSGVNTLGALVGNGYYSGFLGYSNMPMIYGSRPSFLGKLTVTYKDGTKTSFVTDDSWQFSNSGPVLFNDYLNGETYDNRLSYDWEDLKSPKWTACAVIAPPSDSPVPTNGESVDEHFKITAQYGPCATVYKEIQGKFMCEMPTGHFVYDLGQNIVGTVRIRVKGNRGDTIKVQYGEMCYQSGEVYLRNLRSAFNTDVFILNGDSNGEKFIPTFTSHGFRYVEITGNGYSLQDKNIILDVTGLVLTNTVTDTGFFECSDERVNKLFSNILWGQRGNSLLVYTDCPQRNERMGWTGDAQVFARTASYNADIKMFMSKWLRDVQDAQIMYNKQGAVPDTAPLGGDNRADACAGWADAAVIVPWELFRSCGDINILRDNYNMMKNWVEYQNRESRRNTGLRTVDGKEMWEQSDFSKEPYIQTQQSRGDHLTFDRSTPFILSATAYAARVADIMVKVSGFLGLDEDVKKYSELYNNIKTAFCDAWVKADGSIAYWGEMSMDGINKTYYSEKSENKPSQTAYVLALEFNLIPKDKIENAKKYLKQAIKREGDKLTVGFLGISHLNPALTKVGMSDMAYKLLLQDENPSWLYSVKNGATTIWERWNSYIAESDTFGDVSMNSFNHYSYGAVGEWLFMSMLGIEPAYPGYEKILIKPHLGDGISYARGSINSPYGVIKSGWEKTDNQNILRVEIPANTTARVEFGGKVYEIGSGEYEFRD